MKAATRRRKVTAATGDEPAAKPKPAPRRRSTAAKKPKDPEPVSADEAA